MLGKETGKKLIVPAVLVLLIAIAAGTSTLLLIAWMLLLPLMAALLEENSGRVAAAAVCVAAGMAAGLVLPADALPAALTWCAGTLAVVCVPARNRLVRPILWAALCTITWFITLATLMRLTGGHTVNGLAQGICDLINAQPERDTILVNAYNMGLSRVDNPNTVIPSVRMMSSVVLRDEIRLQLLYSLRVTMEETLPTLLCDVVVYHTALTTLLSVLLPDWQRRKKGKEGIFPPLDQWFMPRPLGRGVFALLIVWLIAFLSNNGLMHYLGALCSDVFRAAFMLQGICFLQWLGKRIGIRVIMRNIWSVVLAVLIPIVPILMGVFDQQRDARHLRPKKEAGQE